MRARFGDRPWVTANTREMTSNITSWNPTIASIDAPTRLVPLNRTVPTWTSPKANLVVATTPLPKNTQPGTKNIHAGLNSNMKRR